MEDKPVYLDPSAPVELRVRDLLKRMTLEEKLSQLQSVWPRIFGTTVIPREKLEDLLKTGIGELTRLSGALGVNPGDGARMANEIQRILVEKTRLHIPAIVHEECLTGFLAMGATVFPQAIGLAS
ncbi:MAG: glycoside hydrolase family 3 N-terminal domain-containing protein, partial [Thermoproteota archaeon]